MKNIYHLFEMALQKAESGLWYDADKKAYDPHGWGIVLKFLAGSFARPVPKFWTGENPWTQNAWFTIRLPFVVLPFLSIAAGSFGFYIGGKSFLVDPDEPWSKPSEWGRHKLTISATIRRTRWK